MNEWMNEWMSEWVSDWMNEWLTDWMKDTKNIYDIWAEIFTMKLLVGASNQ